MALFGTQNAVVGVDIGTSSLKIVELVNRRKRLEVAAYAQADMPNMLVDPPADSAQAVKRTADLLSSMMEKAGVVSDMVVAGLPSSSVFSTVMEMPDIPDEDLEKAVKFAARDVVPADLDEMVIGWSRATEAPHMETDETTLATKNLKAAIEPATNAPADILRNVGDTKVSVFLTAAPQVIVNRYLEVVKTLDVKLLALEVETFPLARSLLSSERDSALLVDIGDLNTTFHIIDTGTPRVTHSIEYGGQHITEVVMHALGVSEGQADEIKAKHGLLAHAPSKQRTAIELLVQKQVDKAEGLLSLYQQKENRAVSRSILIGGGANLPGLKEFWSKQLRHATTIGNPWKGLAYPQELERHLQYSGPTYGVAVGLALRGMR